MSNFLVQRYVSANYVISLVIWLLLLTATIVIGSLIYFVNTLNTFAADELYRRVNLAIQLENKRTQQVFTEYSYWDQAYENTIVNPNADWIKNNSGEYLLKAYDLDFSLAVHNHNTNTYLAKSDDATLITFNDILNQGLAQMMNLSMKANSESKVITQFMLLDNDVYLVTGGPYLDEEKETPRLGTYLIFGKKVDRTYIDELAFNYDIIGLKLTSASDNTENTLALISTDGTLLAKLAWTPHLAGEETIPFIAILITSFFIATIITTQIILRRELTNRASYEEKLYLEATRDSLTNTNNRRYFMEVGNKEFLLFRNQERHFTLIALDIDHFKKINDTYGHKAGDKALVHFAQQCRKSLRDSDIFGRIGGEEFAIALPNTDIKNAALVANRIRNKVMESKIAFDDVSINMTVSIGIATLEQQPRFDILLEQADKALYQAKSSGRNQVVVYE